MATTREPLIGAHVSVAGGFPRAIERGVRLGCRTIQIFLKGTVSWHARPLETEEARRFREANGEAGLRPILGHASYLVNLAEGDTAARRRAVDGLLQELERAEALGVEALVLHPGAHRGAGARAGIERVRAALEEILERTRGQRVAILLENTAGAGTSLGATLGQLGALLAGTGAGSRLGVCIDTCHAHAAGYDLRGVHAWGRFWAGVEREVGLARVGAIHVNDSKCPLGGRSDRHEHLGRGQIGALAFRLLIRDPRLAGIPKVIETPKAGDMDRRNLAFLRRAATGRGAASSRGPSIS